MHRRVAQSSAPAASKRNPAALSRRDARSRAALLLSFSEQIIIEWRAQTQRAGENKTKTARPEPGGFARE